jgi:hypothetical protein
LNGSAGTLIRYLRCRDRKRLGRSFRSFRHLRRGCVAFSALTKP